jgi:hypothetical protein
MDADMQSVFKVIAREILLKDQRKRVWTVSYIWIGHHRIKHPRVHSSYSSQ